MNKTDRYKKTVGKDLEKVCKFCKLAPATLRPSISDKYKIWHCISCGKTEPIKIGEVNG